MKGRLIRLTALATAAAVISACSGLPGRSGEPGEIKEAGMACTTLGNASMHEAVRAKKDATLYEISALMSVPGCIMVTQIGRKVTAYGSDYTHEGGSFYRVIPDGNFQTFWIPSRMIRWL